MNLEVRTSSEHRSFMKLLDCLTFYTGEMFKNASFVFKIMGWWITSNMVISKKFKTPNRSLCWECSSPLSAFSYCRSVIRPTGWGGGVWGVMMLGMLWPRFSCAKLLGTCLKCLILVPHFVFRSPLCFSLCFTKLLFFEFEITVFEITFLYLFCPIRNWFTEVSKWLRQCYSIFIFDAFSNLTVTLLKKILNLSWRFELHSQIRGNPTKYFFL